MWILEYNVSPNVLINSAEFDQYLAIYVFWKFLDLTQPLNVYSRTCISACLNFVCYLYRLSFTARTINLCSLIVSIIRWLRAFQFLMSYFDRSIWKLYREMVFSFPAIWQYLTSTMRITEFNLKRASEIFIELVKLIYIHVYV